MAGMNQEHINPFLIASTKVLKDMCHVEATIGKPSLRTQNFNEATIVIIIGIIGEIQGQVLISFENDIACDIASKMCMMPITQMDELPKSAICELGNMILGNTATVFSTKGIGVDITTPKLNVGPIDLSNSSKMISIPLNYEGSKEIRIDVSVHE